MLNKFLCPPFGDVADKILQCSYPMVAPPMGASQAGMEVARQFMVVFIGSVGVTVSTTDQVVWGGVIIRWTKWI